MIFMRSFLDAHRPGYRHLCNPTKCLNFIQKGLVESFFRIRTSGITLFNTLRLVFYVNLRNLRRVRQSICKTVVINKGY